MPRSNLSTSVKHSPPLQRVHRLNVQHEMKCWKEFFEKIVTREKKHDLRRATDRLFNVGDIILLREWDKQSESYTGRVCYVCVTFITNLEAPCAYSAMALSKDFCILSINLLQEELSEIN